MEKNLNETKIFELFETNFDAKAKLYSDSLELGAGFPYEVLSNIIKSTLRGTIAYVKQTNSDDEKTAIHVVDEKNNFIVGLVVTKEVDDDGKDAYELTVITDEGSYDEAKESFDKIVEANEPAYVKFLADFLEEYSHKVSKNGTGIKVGDTAGVMYIVLMAFFMSVNTYANNLTKDEVTEDGGIVINYEDELQINISEDSEGKRCLTVEPGTALKTFAKDDKGIQE